MTIGPGINAVAQALIDIDHLALQLFSFLIPSLLLNNVDQHAENACRIGVEFSGLGEAAEQRAPHVRFAFADPSLLDLNAPLQRQRPVRRALKLSLRRLAFPL